MRRPEQDAWCEPSPSRALSARLRLYRATEESTAAAIYGLIVSGAVLAASHADHAWQVATAVLVTLAVYWSAERYARLVAERIHGGHAPSWRRVRERLTEGWELVTASFVPLACLLVVRGTGSTTSTAVLWSLLGDTLVLGLVGWEIGSGQLTRVERTISAVVAAAFGAGMIVLKTLTH